MQVKKRKGIITLRFPGENDVRRGPSEYGSDNVRG